jgi:hypothetical protein
VSLDHVSHALYGVHDEEERRVKAMEAEVVEANTRIVDDIPRLAAIPGLRAIADAERVVLVTKALPEDRSNPPAPSLPAYMAVVPSTQLDHDLRTHDLGRIGPGRLASSG